MHDPMDQSTKFKFSQKLYDNSRSNEKYLVKIEDGKHLVMVNSFDKILLHTLSFILRKR